MAAKNVTQPKIPKLISVYDVMDRPDIPYYIASMIAETFRKKVLIIDNSENTPLYHAVADSGTGEIKKSGNLYFLAAVAYSKRFFDRFDCCICYHGSFPTEEIWQESSCRLLLTGYRPHDTGHAACPYGDDYKPLSVMDKKSDCVFFLNHVTNKVKAENILAKYSLADTENCIPYLELDMDEAAEICLLSLLYNGTQDAKATGKELYSAVTGFVAACTQMPLAELKKMRR